MSLPAGTGVKWELRREKASAVFLCTNAKTKEMSLYQEMIHPSVLLRAPHLHWSGLPHNVRASQMYLYGENILRGEILIFTTSWTQKYPVITLSQDWATAPIFFFLNFILTKWWFQVKLISCSWLCLQLAPGYLILKKESLVSLWGLYLHFPTPRCLSFNSIL